MKLNFWKLNLGMALICGGGWLAGAAPLQRGDLVAAPAWLVHLDCDALRPTTIGQFVLAELDKPEAKEKLAGFQTIYSFDPRTELHGLTLYGTSQTPEDGVLIVYADFDAKHLDTLAEGAKEASSSRHGNHVIHSWVDDHARHGNGGRIYGAIQGKRVVFGQREAAVAQALDVLDGHTPNLASSKDFPELGNAGGGRFLEAAAHKMKIPDSNPQAAILRQLKGAQIAVGEQQGQFQGKLTLLTDSDDVGGQVYAIANGLVSLMKLQKDKPDSKKFADALELKQDGARVMGSISLPAGDVVKMIKAGQARKEARESQ